VGRLRRVLDSYGAVAFYALLVVVQVVAAGVAANETSGGAMTVIIATLLVTLAATVREMVREIRSPHSKHGRKVAQSSELLDLLTDRLPKLTNDLTQVLISSPDQRPLLCTALDHSVLAEAAALRPNERVRGALFWRHNGDIRADPHVIRWSQPPQLPQTGSPEFRFLCDTLDDPACARVIYVPNRFEEESLRALAFGLSKEAKSWLAVPVRCRSGVVGFLHLEADNANTFGLREGAVAEVLTSLLAAARVLESSLGASAPTLEGGGGGAS